ncbi:MAG: family 20 glycosylhydrolase [Bacteroidales bacterium]|jgi:hexosaminidase|nr:family 20 glycosylhydrolase [Bacteroidales bacterium]
MNMLKYLLLCLCLWQLPAFAQEPNLTKPFVIPELKEWKAGKGQFRPATPLKIVTASGSEKLADIATLFSRDYQDMFGREALPGNGRANQGEIVLQLIKDKKLGKEGYRIRIDTKITVTANTPTGIFWATRTLLQMTEQNNDGLLPCGEITDFPDYELRGFMLDCGRKFIPLPFLEDYVKIMAYYKMKTFQIHLNDNGFKQFFENDWQKTYAAFRLESEKFPGLTARDGSYSKKEFIGLQQLAERYFVEIIPEIDVPAHSLAFVQYDSLLDSKEYGSDHLDLFAPQTYRLLDTLFKEYLDGESPVFRGKRVHIGTDEYSNKKPEVVEKFRYFTDYYINYIQGFGKQACIWGALTHAKGETPVRSDSVLMWVWHNAYAQPDTMIQEGFDVVSIPDGWLYIVPNAGYYYDYLNTQRLYNEWTPAVIGKKVFDEKHPSIKGGMFAVWNDHVGNGISTKDIHDRAYPAMQTLAVKMWTGKNPQFPFETFNTERQKLSEAPGVNQAGRIKTAVSREIQEPVYKKPVLNPGDETGYKEIGYGYTVSFEITGAEEAPGTELFRSPHAVFYLSDPIKGMVGFAREGYLNTFNYSIRPGETARIKICGNNKETRLYVNDRLIPGDYNKKIWFNEGKASINYIQTLVFPLEKAGNFKSSIRNLEITQQ